MQGLSGARTTRTAVALWPVTGPTSARRRRGTLIARWYCRESHTTFSLLPDCLAARLPGTLDALEAAAVAAEEATEP